MTEPAVYSAGTTLAEIPPDFHGMPYSQWESAARREYVAAECNAYLKLLSDKPTAAAKRDQKKAKLAL